MQDQPATPQQRIATTLATLAQMEQQLRATQADVRGLPFFARSFVDKDVSGSTGRSFAEWIAAAGRLRAALEPLATASVGTPADGARALIGDELPRLARLRAYLLKAPDKLNMVPGGMLKPQQRSSFLGRVQQQAADVQALESELGAIAAGLGGAR